ncbi:unnamed protein product [Microthlaspi erraticum]|uniref:Retrotransposon Copia-like N-terminal domain-containing protein n=1 Tax=Microthlaspi erraticum TaxID=1685480 RepID=A0A6D2HST2_9BRAS|nr:unnamed protein product [Microthlaspi erraticum]
MANSGNNSPAGVTDAINTNSQTIFTINMTSVSKLTSTNYLMCSLQVHALLDGYDLVGHLDGSILVPQPTLTVADVVSVNPAYTIWKRQDKLIFSSLIGAISTPIQPIVSRATTAAEVWQTLATTYAKPSRGHIKQLKLQLKQWKKDTKTIDVKIAKNSPKWSKRSQITKFPSLEHQNLHFSLETKPEHPKYGRVFMPSRRPKVMILIWKDRYLSCDTRRSGKRSFGSLIWPELNFYQDMSGKRPSRARGDFDVSIGPSHRAKGLSSS